MRSAPRLVRRAVATGVVDAGAVLAGRVSLVPCSWSNLLHRLELDGRPVAFVKQSGEAASLDGPQGDVSAREGRALRLLAGTALATHLPAALPGSDEETLWTAVLPGTPLVEVLARQPVELAGELGSLLATLHQLPLTGAEPAAPMPWPLLEQLPPSLATTPADSEPGKVLASRLHEHAEPLRRAAAEWQPGAWIHGDLSPTNVLVTELAPRLRLLDLECAGLGDPAWDLATITGSLRAALAVLAPDRAEPTVQSLVTAYQDAGGPGRASPGLELAHTLCHEFRVRGLEYRRSIGAASMPGGAV